MDPQDNNPGDPLQDLAQELKNYNPDASSPTPSSQENDEASAGAPSFTPSADLAATATVSASANSSADSQSDPFDQSASDPINNPTPNFSTMTNTSDDQSSATDKAQLDDLDSNPIKPADPVPGSIGSAKSYADFQADQAKAATKAAKSSQATKEKVEKPTIPTTPVQPNQFAQGPAPEPAPAVVAPDPITANPISDSPAPIAQPTPAPSPLSPTPSANTQSVTTGDTAPSPKKKTSKTTIILLAVLAVIVVACGVVAILFATGIIGGTKTSQQTSSFVEDTSENATPANYSMVCTGGELSDLNDDDDGTESVQKTSSITAKYEEDQLKELVVVEKKTYPTAEEASVKETKLTSDSDGDVAEINQAVERLKLPTLSQEVKREENTVSITRVFTPDFLDQLNQYARQFAEEKDLVEEDEYNAYYETHAGYAKLSALLPLLTDEDNNYLTDSASIQEYLEVGDYSCTTEFTAV